MIEIEFSALARGCLHRRIPTLDQWEREMLALVAERHESRIKINWQFSIDKARQKFTRHYGQMNPDNKPSQCR